MMMIRLLVNEPGPPAFKDLRSELQAIFFLFKFKVYISRSISNIIPMATILLLKVIAAEKKSGFVNIIGSFAFKNHN